MANWEHFVLHVLIELIAIIAAARIGAWVFSKLGQPAVVGEIAAGLLLGPSALGRIAPEWVQFVFPDETAIIFRILSELGLVLFMFLIGLEFDFSHLKNVGRTAVSVAIAGIAIPFGLAVVLALWMHPQIAADMNRNGFVLIIAVALSITAIPILGRIMMEMNLHRTRLGTLTITAAAIDDAIGWILLATVSTMIHSGFDGWLVLRMLGMVIAFVIGCGLFAKLLMPPLETFLLQPSSNKSVVEQEVVVTRELSLTGFSLVLIGVFSSGAITNSIGVFSIFGPFVLGAMLSSRQDFRNAVKSRLQEIVFALFLPIFFAHTGLRTNVGLLDTWNDWILCGILILTATIGKLTGCGIAAKLGGLSWRESGCVALMMNTRALMGLIAINVGRDLGVIPDRVFCMLVIMALVTTLMTTPLMKMLVSPDNGYNEA